MQGSKDQAGADMPRMLPVAAFSPVVGVQVGSGIELGPALLVINALGIGLLVYVIRRRWLAAA